MAKIRALKPEFFTDEKVVEVSPLARLLYQGMWVHACDHGHLPDKPRQLKLRILPADDCSIGALIEELVGADLVQRHDGWLIIPTLAKHQKPDKRYFLPRRSWTSTPGRAAMSTRTATRSSAGGSGPTRRCSTRCGSAGESAMRAMPRGLQDCVSACRARIGVLEKAGPAGNRTLTARPQPIRPGGNGL